MKDVDFSREFANRVSEDQFVDNHKHLGTDAELKAKYKALQDKPDKKADVDKK